MYFDWIKCFCIVQCNGELVKVSLQLKLTPYHIDHFVMQKIEDPHCDTHLSGCEINLLAKILIVSKLRTKHRMEIHRKTCPEIHRIDRLNDFSGLWTV